jgi:protochlorophyllide reductase
MGSPRHVLLTGASSGIGFEAAVRLHRQGHRLTLPCRDARSAAATCARLSEAGGSAPTPTAVVCDLADLASVRRCADALLRHAVPIDSLVLNAGLQYAGERQARRSPQGFELSLAVNHLAHQLLAGLLLPLLDAAAAPRLIVTASEVHDPRSPGGRVGRPAGLGDLTGLRAGGTGSGMLDGRSPFDAEKAYKDSKLCNVLFAREFARRMAERGTPLPVVAWSPGLVIARSTGGFFRYSRRRNELGQRLFALLARDLLRISESPADAGALLASLAAAPLGAESGFRYLANRLSGFGRHRLEQAPISVEAGDDALAATLWRLSATAVGLATDLPPQRR